MPLLFWWKPNNAPVGPNDNRIDIGLELGGDDATLDGQDARIELYEVAGGAGEPPNSQGSAESTQPRLLATFHGKFHRNPRATEKVRLTFELDLGGATAVDPAFAEVQGFDPECIRGIDAFVFTFLNREFQVNFPFFLDTRSEGTFIELQAVATLGEAKGGNEISRSAVLNLRIRRRHAIATTSNTTYTGKVVGNLILHHEDFLIEASSRAASASWPQQISLVATPIALSGAGSIPFQAFQPGDLKIILTNDLIEGLFSSDAHVTNATKTQAKNKIRDVLKTIFTDAGFQGNNVFAFEDESAATSLVTAFRGAFTDHGDQWTLNHQDHPLPLPFWTFMIVRDGTIDPAVGMSAAYRADVTRTQVTVGSQVFLLPYPSPIGSGTKMMEKPLRIRTSYFSPVDNQVDAKSAKVAIVIAHEIGHSIGLMHDIEIMNQGPYDEASASPVMSIMSSSVENDSFGVDMRFSNQVKVIWQTAFNVQPNWDNSYLRNKTWGDDWKNVDWIERKHRFFKLNDADVMASPMLTTVPPNKVPFQGTGNKIQRGTYVP